MAESIENGVGIFDGDLVATWQWHVLHVRPRQEKALASDLVEQKIPHFLPLARHVRHYRNRKILVDLPLFSGYVFVRGSVEHAYHAERTGRVAGIIRVVDQVRLNSELHSIFVAISNGLQLDFHRGMKPGTRVEIRSGALRGIQGVVESRRQGKTRLVLQVEMLGRAVSLDLDASMLDIV